MKKNWPVIILISIAIALCFQNYTPSTILSGWDTLHPEFNFGLNIKREIFGVFRSYQGLGAVAAHSDMADIPRIIVLAIFNLFLPLDFLRYSYIFLNLILGPIGMYYFLKRVVFSKTPNDNTIPSFLGALFYLLNLGTMQQFVVPLEMFTTQYASLPWLFLFATEYLNAKIHQKKTLILFAITTLLSTPMAYAATLWYIYFIAFILYLGVLVLLSTFKRVTRVEGFPTARTRSVPKERLAEHWREGNERQDPPVKKALVLILLILLINSFWILPNIYFVFNHASEVTKANISKLFSPQAFLYNKEFGNIVDISMLKSFLFDWNVYSGSNQFTQLLHLWITHLKQPIVQVLGFLFAGIALSGIAYGIFKKNKIAISFFPLLLFCMFFLFNDNFPSSALYRFLADKIPFFKEAFRFPQDKVFGIFTFAFAIYFSFGQLLITRLISKILGCHCERSEAISYQRDRHVPTLSGLAMTSLDDCKHLPLTRITRFSQVAIFSLLLLYFMLPAFKGYFISPYMRIKIPEVYFKMFKWFDKEPQDGRIANLPINSLWGWEYHDWGFQGAGFIWFGIKQPVLARDFDRWSPYNEQYYREMSYAIYSQNPEALKQVIEKYNIQYILLDKSIIAPQSPSKVLLYKETQDLLGKQDYIQKIKEFGNTIFVYKVKSKTPNSHYTLKRPNEEYYPFRNLIDNQNKILPNIIKLTQEGVVIKLPKNVGNFSLSSYLDIEESIPADLLVEKSNNQLNITFYPRFPIYNVKDKPIPIFVKAELPKNENIILSINKKDNFILETLPSNTPLSLGTIFLKTKEDSTITLYPSTPNEKITPDLSTIKYYIEPCQDIADQKTFGLELAQNNSFNIFAKNTYLCMTIPLSELINKDLKTSEALLNVTFNYKSNLPLKFCISKLINGVCQNYSDNRFNQYFALQKEDIQKLGLQFQLDTTEKTTIEKAMYENLSLSLTNPFFSTSFKPLSTFSTSSTLSTFSTLILPFSGNQELSADITKLPRTTGHCPNHPIFNPPLIKKQILENKEERFIRYESIDGLSCDHFSYQNLSQNEAYLIAITSRNVKGLPSTLCITNSVSKHCDIYTTLSSFKDFNTDIFLLPPQIKNENGFDVNIGNLGIKKSPSVNDIKSIEIIPIPYKWLTHLRHSGDPAQRGTPESVLVLPQSFEKGWKAYRIKNYELGIMNWVSTTFPFVFGKEIKDHVLVNNWANGWILPDQQPTTKDQRLIIIFLPQYLEYLGFILLLGTFTYLTVHAVRNKSLVQNSH